MDGKTVAKRSLTRELLLLIVPITLQNLISAAVNAADVVMLGGVGQDALSAVSAVGQITFVLNLFYFGVAGGLSVLSAQYWGKGDADTVERVLGIALMLSSAVSMLFFALCEAIPGLIIGIFTPDRALIAIGKRYLRVLAISYLMTGVSQVMLAMYKTTGKAYITAAVSVVGLIINVALNALSIYVLFPGDGEKAVIGIAAATCIARLVELVISVVLLRKGSVRCHMKYILHPKKELLGDYFRMAGPMQANFLIWGGGVAAISAIIGHVSSDLLAANAIVSTVRNLATVVCSGISGGSILVGQQLGRNEVETAHKTGNLLAGLSLLLGAVAGGIVLAVQPLAFKLVNLNDTALGYMRQMFWICAVYCIGKSFNSTVVGGIFASGGDTKFGMFCDLIAMWFVIVPAGLIAANVLHWHPVAVYLVLSMDEFVKIPFVIHRYFKKKWLKNITK